MWQDISGTWEKGVDVIKQTVATGGAFRTWLDVGKSNFIIEFTFRIEEGEGEAKFIYSDADQNEEYRIDFLKSGNLYRLSNRSALKMWAPFLIENTKHQVKVFVKDNLVTVIADGMTLLAGFSIGRASFHCAKAIMVPSSVEEPTRG